MFFFLKIIFSWNRSRKSFIVFIGFIFFEFLIDVKIQINKNKNSQDHY